MKTIIYVHKNSELPDVEHWAIIEDRTATGPYEDTEYYVSYTAYLDEKEWRAEIDRRMQNKVQNSYAASFRAMHVKPAKVLMSVSVTTTIS